MERCPAYRQVIPWEKRCMKKEEETGVKPSYCPFNGDIERCRIYEYLVEKVKKSKESVGMIITDKEIDEQLAMYEAEEAKTAIDAGITLNGVTVTATTLKNCSCGGTPIMVCKASIPPYYVIECPKCGKKTSLCGTHDDAEKVWNAIVNEGLSTTAIAKPIQDSGERREFETGAVRDMSEGKGLMVVMPAARHIMKYLDGWDDEDHLAAAAFNILGAMEMEAHKPAMQDIPAREGAKSFNYSQGE